MTLKSFKFLLILLFLSFPVHAETIFEGYYKISAGNRHIGYAIQRARFLPKQKQFNITYYVRTNAAGGNLIESLNAFSNDQFQPLSYQFTKIAGKQVSTIDAKFQGFNMTATISNGQTSREVKKSFKPGTFLAIFYDYLILQQGLKGGVTYNYQAIAEEEGVAHKGIADIQKNMQLLNGQKVFRVLNRFKGSNFTSWITPEAEVIATRSPAQQVTTQLVDAPVKATQGVQVNTAHLKKIFGSIPAGQINVLAKALTQKTQPTNNSAPAQNLNSSGQVKIGKPSANSPANSPSTEQ